MIWKNKWIIVVLIITVASAALFLSGQRKQTAETTYPPESLIRLHILANSDSYADQVLKNNVREEIIRCVSPAFMQTEDIITAREIASAQLPRIKEIAEDTVKAAGRDDDVTVRLEHLMFPTKHYGPFVLPAGDYESVQVVLGNGGGSNWWCVLFPPLCFIDMPRKTALIEPESIAEPSESQLQHADSGPLPEEIPDAGNALQNDYKSSGNDSSTNLYGESQIQIKFKWRIIELLKGEQ